MPRASQRAESAANSDFLDSFAAVSEAVESGAGLPEVARAASRALDASVAVLDSASSVLAVACASPEDERALLGRRVTDRDAIVARAHELGTDLSNGASVIVIRTTPLQATDGNWRARVLT